MNLWWIRKTIITNAINHHFYFTFLLAHWMREEARWFHCLAVLYTCLHNSIQFRDNHVRRTASTYTHTHTSLVAGGFDRNSKGKHWIYNGCLWWCFRWISRFLHVRLGSRRKERKKEEIIDVLNKSMLTKAACSHMYILSICMLSPLLLFRTLATSARVCVCVELISSSLLYIFFFSLHSTQFIWYRASDACYQRGRWHIPHTFLFVSLYTVIIIFFFRSSITNIN